MKRNILLVEPAYITKFPPMGLMKISTYHKQLGDKVRFIKGINKNVESKDWEQNFNNKYWDRIYISTMFTYNWNITVKTIEYYKTLVHGDISRIFVGGIMATLMAKELWEKTGVQQIIRGVLNKPGMLDPDVSIIVDELIPDYNLFEDSKCEYSLIEDSYFGYSTRGCKRSCDFCGVTKLEPDFVEYKGIKDYITNIKEKHGEKEHLVLFDNNILASEKLERVVNDIKDLGFGKDDKFSYIGKVGQTVYKQRRVDFNQGVDARFLSQEKMKLLSELAINPLRIAFDHIKYKKLYSEKVTLAAKNNIKNLSNYILYNHKDTPEDLWNRLKKNIDLNNDLKLKIYSFPMKYIPLNAKGRSYIYRPEWNWHFLRNVQRILNVVRGIVMPGEDFFYRAFGSDTEEFMKILHMPEWILMDRGRVIGSDERDWRNKYNELSNNEKQELIKILDDYRERTLPPKIESKALTGKIKQILDFYYVKDKPKKYKNKNRTEKKSKIELQRDKSSLFN